MRLMASRKGVHCQDAGPEQKWQAGGGAQAWEGRLTPYQVAILPLPLGLRVLPGHLLILCPLLASLMRWLESVAPGHPGYVSLVQ